MMEAKEVDRLIKLLEMTSSDHDGEALNALRLAQKIMKKNNLRLPDIVKFVYRDAQKSQAPIQQPAPRPEAPRQQSPFGSMGGYNNPYSNFWNNQQAQAMNQAFAQAQNAYAYQGMQQQYQASMRDRDSMKKGFFKK